MKLWQYTMTHQWSQIDLPFPPAPAGTAWEKMLEQNGFTFPESPGDCYGTNFHLARKGESFIVEFELPFLSDACVYCPSLPDYMEFLRVYALPLLVHALDISQRADAINESMMPAFPPRPMSTAERRADRALAALENDE